MTTTLPQNETLANTCDADACACDEARADQIARAAETATYRPAVDVVAREDAWFLTADLPGADESTVEVSVEKNILTITADSTWEAPDARHAHTEFPKRRYERSFRLSDSVDREGVTASVRNGVLSLRLPKAAEAQRHVIGVTAG